MSVSLVYSPSIGVLSCLFEFGRPPPHLSPFSLDWSPRSLSIRIQDYTNTSRKFEFNKISIHTNSCHDYVTFRGGVGLKFIVSGPSLPKVSRSEDSVGGNALCAFCRRPLFCAGTVFPRPSPDVCESQFCCSRCDHSDGESPAFMMDNFHFFLKLGNSSAVVDEAGVRCPRCSLLLGRIEDSSSLAISRELVVFGDADSPVDVVVSRSLLHNVFSYCRANGVYHLLVRRASAGLALYFFITDSRVLRAQVALEGGRPLNVEERLWERRRVLYKVTTTHLKLDVYDEVVRVSPFGFACLLKFLRENTSALLGREREVDGYWVAYV